jgi:hypothetical protein
MTMKIPRVLEPLGPTTNDLRIELIIESTTTYQHR